MILLTAYNLDVQRYMQGVKLNSKQKDIILNSIKQSVIESGKSFYELFPNKQYLVLEKITYLLSGCGLWKIGADKLAEDLGVSKTTVYNAVKAIKQTGKILVGRLADDGAGKYIFVLKDHENFKEILKEVFFIDELPVEEEQVEKSNKTDAFEGLSEGLSEGQFVGLQNHESLEGVSLESENSHSNNINSFKSFNSKQEKNIIKDSIESELIEATKKQKESEHLNTYYTNEFQFELYHAIKKHTYHEQIKNNASILGLRVGSNADKAAFLLAIKAIWKIDRFLRTGGTVDTTVPALFTKLYTDLIKEYSSKPSKSATASVGPIKAVPLWNWLEEDSNRTPVSEPATVSFEGKRLSIEQIKANITDQDEYEVW